MKANLSPLSIVDFGITSMDLKTIHPEDPENDPTDYFYDYEIDIDFGIQVGKFINVYIIAKVNYGEETLPGYSFCAQAGCFFQFNGKTELTASQKAELEGFSTIYIALNSLRGLISSFTANAPYGRYILPSIDLNDLIAKKRMSISKTDKIKPNEKNIFKKLIFELLSFSFVKSVTIVFEIVPECLNNPAGILEQNTIKIPVFGNDKII